MIGATSVRINAEIARQGKLAQSLARAQTDISTTKRIQVGSDDPVAAARVADVRRTQANEATWATNIEHGSVTATRVDSALESHFNNLVRAQELLIQAKNGTMGSETRAVVASQLTSIADEIAQAAAAKDPSGRALFPEGQPLQLPIGEGVTTAVTVDRATAFGDIEATLRAAAAGIAAGDDAAAATGLDKTVAATETLSVVRAEHGVRAARLDAARDRFADSAVDLDEERGTLEGTDLAETLAKATALKLNLDAAQSVFAKLNAKSLFDLI